VRSGSLKKRGAGYVMYKWQQSNSH
jgi:hypothetical protein